MYDLARDPNEVDNLVEVDATPPAARAKLPHWADHASVQHAANELAELLAELERRNL
jgi:hypothetical protein